MRITPDISILIGEKVMICSTSGADMGYKCETGTVTNIIVPNSSLFFIELNNKNYISSRFIINIEKID